MCAIIGIASNRINQNPDLLISARDKMIHRGPDDAGVWWSKDKTVGLAHRRLSVIDTSSSGHQPMIDNDSGLVMVFNGEIYNYKDIRAELLEKGHKFHSQTDTEVLLMAYKEWGKNCLHKINGMFAFVIYDMKKRILFSARDRAGEKPLFYSLNNGELRFSSELKGLLAFNDSSFSVNPEAMDTYLTFGYVPGNLCILNHVYKLPPAHAFEFSLENNNFNIWEYWELPSCNYYSKSKLTEEVDLLDEFENLLKDAVKKQMNSDVPLGVLLSGGIDSSIVAATAKHISGDIKTFNVSFEGYENYDESFHAKKVANYLGTEHFELNAGKVKVDIMNKLAKQYDEPMADSSMIPTFLVSKIVREHCTVALGGDGGDELFGGYPHYSRLLWRQKNLDWIPLKARKIISNCALKFLSTGFRGKNWLSTIDSDLSIDLPLISLFFNSSERKNLMNTNTWQTVAEQVWKKNIPLEDDLLSRATKMDFKNYMPEDILVKVDRASMLNSLEIRCPFLDHRIIEYSYGNIPPSMKTNLSQKKIFLKKIAKRILPSDFDMNRKQGFSIPLKEWINKGPWRDFFRDVLFDKQSIFNNDIVSKLFHNQDRGYNNSERLFNLVLFELWRREYSITI